MRTERHRPCCSTNSLSSLLSDHPHRTFQHHKKPTRCWTQQKQCKHTSRQKNQTEKLTQRSFLGFLRFGHAHSEISTHFLFLWSTNFSCLALPSCSPSSTTDFISLDQDVPTVLRLQSRICDLFQTEVKGASSPIRLAGHPIFCRTYHSSLFKPPLLGLFSP